MNRGEASTSKPISNTNMPSASTERESKSASPPFNPFKLVGVEATDFPRPYFCGMLGSRKPPHLTDEDWIVVKCKRPSPQSPGEYIEDREYWKEQLRKQQAEVEKKIAKHRQRQEKKEKKKLEKANSPPGKFEKLASSLQEAFKSRKSKKSESGTTESAGMPTDSTEGRPLGSG